MKKFLFIMVMIIGLIAVVAPASVAGNSASQTVRFQVINSHQVFLSQDKEIFSFGEQEAGRTTEKNLSLKIQGGELPKKITVQVKTQLPEGLVLKMRLKEAGISAFDFEKILSPMPVELTGDNLPQKFAEKVLTCSLSADSAFKESTASGKVIFTFTEK